MKRVVAIAALLGGVLGGGCIFSSKPMLPATVDASFGGGGNGDIDAGTATMNPGVDGGVAASDTSAPPLNDAGRGSTDAAASVDAGATGAVDNESACVPVDAGFMANDGGPGRDGGFVLRDGGAPCDPAAYRSDAGADARVDGGDAQTDVAGPVQGDGAPAADAPDGTGGRR